MADLSKISTSELVEELARREQNVLFLPLNDISKKIKERRKELGLSQEDLAKKIGYKSAASINRIEAGSANIPARKFDKFAEALEMAIKELFGLDEELNNEIKKPAEERLERLKQIADHKGIITQLEQLIEESAELIVAVRHCLREPNLSNIPVIAEEIADVEIMIEQIKYLLDIGYDVEQYYKPAKIERTLKRIEQEVEKNEKEEPKVQSI